ncbi:MAG: hypothetical protein ACI9MJ_001951 [Alphaproteobacteria bacterium]|jgi:hypothetical protein
MPVWKHEIFLNIAKYRQISPNIAKYRQISGALPTGLAAEIAVPAENTCDREIHAALFARLAPCDTATAFGRDLN